MTQFKGFTLIELMVAIAITAIMLTMAVPGFQNLMLKNRLDGVSTDMLGALMLARSESIKRGEPVSVCARSTGTSCTGGNWDNGWVIFVDPNGNGAIDAGETTILKVHDALDSNYSAASDTFAGAITYQRNGMASNTGIFVFCHSNDKTTARGIVATLTRPKYASDINGNGIPEKEDASGNLSDINSCGAP